MYLIRVFTIAMLLVLPCILCLPARILAASIATVDMDHIMLHAKASAEGRAHLEEVRKRLEKGYADLQAAWQKTSGEEYETVMAEGRQALRRQLQLEENAALEVVNNLVLEVVREWRKNHNGLVVIARQNLLDADDSIDITRDIVTGMDARKATFPKLPEIAINNPGQKPAPVQGQPQDTGHDGAIVRAPVSNAKK